jgi:arabinose-5-phosphate isomerase
LTCMETQLQDLLSSSLDSYQQAFLDKKHLWRDVLPGFATFLHKKNGRVIFCGMGKSGWVAGKLTATFNGLGVSAAWLHAAEALHGDAGMLQSTDTLIVVSKSGSGPEVLAVSRLAKEAGIPVAGILGNVHSPVAALCAWVLNCSVEREADPDNLAPTVSTMISLVCGEILALSLKTLRGFNAGDFARIHPAGQLGRNLNLRVADIMHCKEKVACVNPQTGLRETLVQMTEFSLGAACVLESGKLIGVITDGDLRRGLINGINIDDVTAQVLMNRNPVTIHPEQTLLEALEQMEGNRLKLSVLPVVDKEFTLVGLIRLHDIYG